VKSGISIERETGVPLYLQLKRQVERLVRAGVWEEGRKVPTERELAATLGVSRHTVSASYKQLQEEGLLVSRQGCGTFVASGVGPAGQGAEQLERVVDLALDEALALGMSVEDFLEVASERARARKDLLRHIQVAFVECNREQLDYFAKEIELGSGVSIAPVLIEDLRNDPFRSRNLLSRADLVVTTFFHLDEVRKALPDQEVVGIALDPLMETMVRLARIPPGCRVGLVCLSERFAGRVKKSMANVGLDAHDLVFTTTKDRRRLKKFIDGLQVAITSPGRRREVEEIADGDIEIVEFIYRPDAGSINLLRSALWERKRAMVEGRSPRPRSRPGDEKRGEQL